MDSSPRLSTLTPEILQLVIEHTHASAHWPLAQTCRHIYLNSKPILGRHRKAHQEFRVTSDLDPQTSPNLLWSVFSHGASSIEAWHVREYEVWVDREECEFWRVDADTGKRVLKADAEPWSLPGHDIDYFCDRMLKLPPLYGEGRNLNEEVRWVLEAGHDSFVKALLFAHLPRIRALRYAQFDDEREHWSLNILCCFIYWCKSSGTWLPGLESLEKVAVAIGLDRAGVEVVPPEYLRRNADEFCALLCLPNLSELYFSHLDGCLPLDERSKSFPSDIDPLLAKTSPVRTIILDMVEYSMTDRLIDFVASTPRRLKNLAIRFARNNDDDDTEHGEMVIHKLSKHQGKSLQRLCIHDDRKDDEPSYINWRTPDELASFGDLRVANVSWQAIEASLDPTGDTQSRSELLDRLLEVFRHGLPATMEIITFGQFERLDPVFFKGETGGSDLAYVDDAIEAMIRSERYKNLQVVFLHDMQTELSYNFSSTIHLLKTTKAAEERGVYVNVEGSKPPSGLSSNGEFISFPRRDCMVSGGFETEDRDRLYATKIRHFLDR